MRPGLRIYLLALALTLLLPALGLGAAAVWQAVRSYQAQFDQRLLDTSRALALALDAEIGAFQAAMEALTGSTSLDGPAPDLARVAAGVNLTRSPVES